MDWKLKPLPSGEPAYSDSLRAFISELRAMGKQVILLAPTPVSYTHLDVYKRQHRNADSA